MLVNLARRIDAFALVSSNVICCSPECPMPRIVGLQNVVKRIVMPRASWTKCWKSKHENMRIDQECDGFEYFDKITYTAIIPSRCYVNCCGFREVIQ